MAAAITEGGRALVENVESPEGGHMKTCRRCQLRFDWRKSTSGSLKMTYCGTLCEIADTGTTIETLLSAARPPKRVPIEEPLG